MTQTDVTSAAAVAPPARRRFRLGRLAAILMLFGLTALGAGLAASQVWARHHLRAAREALDRHHHDEAAAHVQACLRVWPRDADALWIAARAARCGGHYAQAQECLDRCESQHGSDERLALERLLLRVERGEPEAALGLCREMLAQHNPDAPVCIEAMVRGLLRQFRLREADFWLKQWLEVQPDNAQALCLSGDLYSFGGRKPDALALYRRALAADPDHDEARLSLAELLLLTQKGAEAKPELERLLQRRPDDPTVPVQLARCLEQLGQMDKARAALDDVLARWPDHQPALTARGRLAAEEGQFQQAEPLLRRALELKPSDYDTRFQLALCLRRAGKLEEAQEQQKLVRQAEADGRRLQEIISREMQERPHDAALHFEVAQIRFREGAIAESLRWLHSTLKEDPRHAGAHRALAGYYRRAGNPILAAKHEDMAGPEPAAGR
jgi:tetratricopeptide (TPR) repeat protein